MARKKLPKRKDKKIFRDTAVKSKKINVNLMKKEDNEDVQALRTDGTDRQSET